MMREKKLDINMQKRNLDLNLTLYVRIGARWIRDLNVK